jgi:uncharacterized protein (DUF305 family)
VLSLTARIAAIVAASTALLLSGCGSPVTDGSRTHPAQTDEPHITGEPAGNNAHDIAFVGSLIPHHQQGIDMSVLVPGRSTNPQIVAGAAKSAAALQTDIVILRASIVQWDQNPKTATGNGGQGMSTKGMLDPAAIAKLHSLHGGEFDALWLHSMITLDQGAIEMANAELTNGKNADAVVLARQIIDAGQAEIRQMKQILKD